MAIRQMFGRSAMLGILAGIALAAPSFANDDRLIKSQSITMLISAGPGSGYDTYGRLAARHLGLFLPGHPTIVPMNMPGADGLQGATWLYQSAPRDGSAIGILENSTPFEPLLKKTKTPIDPLKISWLGSLNRIANIALVWNTSSIKTTDEMFGRPIIVGATSGNSDSVSMPRLLNKMIGTKFKIVTGYGSSNEIVLAMERGEVEGALGISSDSLEGPFGTLIANHKMRILMQIDAEKFDDTLLNSVPSIMDYVKSPEDRQVLELILAKLEYGRPFAAPPGLAPAVLEQLRTAFANMSVDPLFLADAAKMGIPTHFSSGDHIAQSIAALYKTPQPIIDEASTIVGGSSEHP
jgi:tripartite-type tricarboxylate transporter receptor subunit TctC